MRACGGGVAGLCAHAGPMSSPSPPPPPPHSAVQGDVNYAFDTAVTGQPEAATPGLAHARAWLGAGIKWRQWEEAMAAVAARLGRSADQEGSGFEPWQHNSVLWARAGRGAREMADEAAALCRVRGGYRERGTDMGVHESWCRLSAESWWWLGPLAVHPPAPSLCNARCRQRWLRVPRRPPLLTCWRSC